MDAWQRAGYRCRNVLAPERKPLLALLLRIYRDPLYHFARFTLRCSSIASARQADLPSISERRGAARRSRRSILIAEMTRPANLAPTLACSMFAVPFRASRK